MGKWCKKKSQCGKKCIFPTFVEKSSSFNWQTFATSLLNPESLHMVLFSFHTISPGYPWQHIFSVNIGTEEAKNVLLWSRFLVVEIRHIEFAF